MTGLSEDKLKDVCFSIFKDNSIQTVSAQDLLRNKRVLISSVVRPCQVLTHKYITAVYNQKQFLFDHGIDEICLVYSAGGKFLLTRVTEHYKSFTGLYDNDQNFLKYLVEKQGKSLTDLRKLSNLWGYHALFNNGELEFFIDQPTDNFMKHLISHLSRRPDGERLMWYFRTNQKQYMDPQCEPLLFNRQVFSHFEKTPANGKLIFYYNTWLDGTTPLEKYLIDTKTNI